MDNYIIETKIFILSTIGLDSDFRVCDKLVINIE